MPKLELYDPKKHIKIRTISEARKEVGKHVLWDELNLSDKRDKPNYISVCSGTLDEVGEREVCVSGRWLSLHSIWSFRVRMPFIDAPVAEPNDIEAIHCAQPMM